MQIQKENTKGIHKEIVKEEQAEVLKHIQGLHRLNAHSLVNVVGEKDSLRVPCQTSEDWRDSTKTLPVEPGSKGPLRIR